LKLVFAGTPEFSVAALDALHAAGHDIVAVYTQPDRPAGRGQKLTPSPVAQRAAALGLPTFKPEKLRGNEPAIGGLRKLAPDLMIVVAYGLILPQAVLDVPRLGCFNIHASLLPRWRGAAPIHRAIEAGDTQTGVTIMQMDEGLDTGDMLLIEREPIRPDDTTASLHDRLAELGGRLIVEALEAAACGGLQATPQPAEGITYAHKIEKAEATIDWAQPAAVIERRVRAFDPFPGAVTACGGEAIKVWASRLVAPPSQALPGEVLAVDDRGIVVATGDGALSLTALQRAGGKRLQVADFLRGFPLAPGQRLG